jgi:hypothetical protein
LIIDGGGHTIAIVDGPGRIPLPEQQAPGFDALPSAAMVTQHEAARYLGVSPGKIGWLVFRGHLAGSRHGVTAGSLRREKQWRATASPGQKVRRVLTDALQTLLDGF